MTNGFGLDSGEEVWKEYIGRYVVIYPSMHQATFSGKLTRIEDGYGILHPHISGHYDKEKGLIRHLVNEDSKVDMTHLVAIEPTTRKSIEASCEFLNTQTAMGLEKSKIELEKSKSTNN